MLDVLQSPELQAAILALKVMNRDLRRDIAKEAKPGLTALWTHGLEQRARTNLERRILVPGAKVAVSGQVVRASAATSRRALGNGLVPANEYAGAEFGMMHVYRHKVQGRSPRGKAYTYLRHLTQFRADRQKQGHVAYSAARELTPEIISGWVQVIVGKLAGSFESER